MSGLSPQIAAVCNLTALAPGTMLAALADRSQLPRFDRGFIGLIVASPMVVVQGAVVWPQTLALMAGTVVGRIAGSYLAHAIPREFMRISIVT